MRLNRKSLTVVTSVPLFAAIGLYLGAVQVSADPLAEIGDQKLNSPPISVLDDPSISVLDDPLLGSNSPYPFRDAYPYTFNNLPVAHAILSVPQTRIHQVRLGADPSGELFTVDIRLYNDSGDRRSFYNLDWDGLIPLPGHLALYDAQKHYICDLLARFGGSSTSMNERDWTDVSASSYMGKILYASLPYPSYKVTPPGKYYLQVIYLQRFVRPSSQTNMRADKPDPVGESELFRSNVVPITVEQPQTKPADRGRGL